MQYTKPMIELVFEIRRRVNANHKPGVKLANPELLTELAGLCRASGDTVTKALIKELLSLAGPEWSALLNDDQAKLGRHALKVYRGQSSLETKPVGPAPLGASLSPIDNPSGQSETGKETKVRYYRGARIA